MVRITSLMQTCEMCPSQWEGRTDDDREVYIRYRHGHGYVSVGAPGDHTRFAALNGQVVARWDGDDALDGFISTADMMDRVKYAVAFELTEGGVP